MSKPSALQLAPRVLVADIETLPIEGYVWQLFDQNVGLEQIKTEWSIASYAAKWLGESKIFYENTGGRGPKKVRDDKKLMQPLWDLLDEADIVVAQNGQKFDIKKINARLIEHGFKPYSPIRIVDTYLVAKKHFGFTSNRLAWMADHLTDTPKSEHKKFPGFELWKEWLADNPAAWVEGKKYNVRDIIATEQVYLKQLPWIKGHPNRAAYSAQKGPTCTNCGSAKLQYRGYEVTQQSKFRRTQCTNCGKWGRGKQNLIDKDTRAVMLVS